MPKWKTRDDSYGGVYWREHPFFRFDANPSQHLRGIRIVEAAKRKAEREVGAYLLGAYISN